MASQQAVVEDLTSVQWRSVEWVTAFGTLTPANVLDYFAQSPFYDPTSNNAVLRMQTQFSVEAHSGFNEAEELKRFVGVEFAVTHNQPPDLFVIEKRQRSSPTDAKPISAYYVLNNSIYQAPDLYTVISNRLLSSLFYMQSSLGEARNHKTAFTPRTGGNQYKVVKPEDAVVDVVSAPQAAEGQSQEAAPAASSNKKSSQNLDFLLGRALESTVEQMTKAQQQ